jgi:sodium-dependent dicarboxylate transporter 2/3/5
VEEPTGRPRPLVVLVVALCALVVSFLPLGLEPAAHQVLTILVVAGGLWATEALPVPITALAIPVLGVVLGAAPAKAAFAGFGDPIVFLFMGTFLLTDACDRHGLNRRLAGAVLGSAWVRARPNRMVWAIAFLGVAISAWVNNTATTALLLPLALSAERLGDRRLVVAVLLMTSWAPSLGGLATPVGTAPNLIGLRLLEQASGARPTFAAWTAMCAPLAIVATAIAGWWLVRGAGREARVPLAAGATTAAGATAGAVTDADAADAVRRPWSLAERTLVPLFVVVILLWILPGILEATPLRDASWVQGWRTHLPEPVVPLLGALALFLLPAGEDTGARILDVSVLRRIDWGTLMLFGGGLSLGAMMFESGLARAIGEAIFRAVPFGGTFGVVLAATLMAIVVSEVTSNTASASLVIPVVLALSQVAGVDPVKPAIAATIGCSFGFMLPVSTPPNALVYGTGRVRITEMIRHGLLLDVVGAILVSLWVTYWP